MKNKDRWTLEELAENKPFSHEEHMMWLKQPSRPTCSCLRAMETGVPPMMFCFVSCLGQGEIIRARNELKKQQEK